MRQIKFKPMFYGVAIMIANLHCTQNIKEEPSANKTQTLSDELQLGLADLESMPIDDTDMKEMLADLEKKLVSDYDLDGDGQLSEDEKAKAKEAVTASRNKSAKNGRLAEYDLNKDGTLDESEKSAAIAALKEKFSERIKEYDTDGDGTISDEERQVAIDARKAEKESHQKDVNDIFTQFDQDGDDALSVEELPEHVADNEKLKDLLASADANGDGVVTLEEAKAAMPSSR